MSTGIEVIGTVVALYQLINASAGLVSEFKAVCDGEPTANDHLEEHAKNLTQACALTQARHEAMSSLEKLSDGEKRVQKTAEKCQASAQALLGELRYVKKSLESKNCMGVVAYVVKSKVHRKKIERISVRFKNDHQELQTILQSEILSQNQAMEYLQREEFNSFEEDIQILIGQVSEGFFGLRGFIEAQNKATKKVIETRLDATDNLIVHGVAELQQGIKEHFTATQREIFLDSFRYPEINMRYNDVLDSSEANFDRVFESYEKVTKHDQKSASSTDDSIHSSSEASKYDGSHRDFPGIGSDELRTIDKKWSSFISWLRSSDPLFCIQGKPGSGKSTLIKFMIDNQSTQRLLKHQSPDIVIMSHFFWKIGSKEQSSIKGFLCSLVNQLLARSERLQELAMGLYDTAFHKSHHDWSSKTLKILLRQILDTKSPAICVFVDGLDEVANDDGLDKLTREIEEIMKFPEIKICVSSRPEASVIKWLRRLNTPSILLEDLTRPGMSNYVHKGLDPLLSSKKLSLDAHRYICNEIVRKSQGVFLWLFLVLRSLIDGIQNGDTEQILMKRLAELPSKIHDLYADIWDRLNERSPVYRRDAARFVLYVLKSHWRAVYFCRQGHFVGPQYFVKQPLLGQIAFAAMSDRHESLLKYGDRIDTKELHEACELARKQIQIKCGGLLQVRMQEKGEGIPVGDTDDLLMQQVGFIHRTAHDFFTMTETGRSILRADYVACEFEIALRAAKGLLCLHRIVAHQHGLSAEMVYVITQFGLLSQGHHNTSVVTQTIEMLPVLQSFFAENSISGNGIEYPKCHFLTYLVPYISFHKFVESEIKKASSARLPTQILQEICYEMGNFSSRNRLVPFGLIGTLTSMGADAHACVMDPREGPERREKQLAFRGTSFANSLKLSITPYFISSYKDGDIATMVSEVVTTMAVTCPGLNDATLIVFQTLDTGRIMLERDKGRGHGGTRRASIFVESELSFLVAYLFSQLKQHIKENGVFKGFPGKFEARQPEIRFIFTPGELPGDLICNRISSQGSCEKLVDFLFPWDGPPPQISENRTTETRKSFGHLVTVLRDLDVIPCDIASEVMSIAAHKLGICNFQEAGIVRSFEGVKELQEARGDSDSNIIHELVALATHK